MIQKQNSTLVYNWNEIEKASISILTQMYKIKWLPDYIVGITRGGLPMAVMLSHMIDCPMHTLSVRLRDHKDTETNCWMSIDAFGYNDSDITNITGARWDPRLRKNILIVDDINDSGETFRWIKEDWQTTCFPNETSVWKSIWNNNVKFAVIDNNAASTFEDVDFFYNTIDKSKNEEGQWLVYPWEVVGEYPNS